MLDIVLLTASTPAYSCLADVTEPNKQEYCERWRLKYRRIEYPTTYHGWDRPGVWLEALAKCDWMFWIGADAMITNMTIPPKWFTKPGAEFVFTNDIHGLQDDVFWLRNTAATRQMLTAVSAARTRCMNEQYALAQYLGSNDTKIVPRIVRPCQMQAYPDEPFYRNGTKYANDLTVEFWKPGAFSMHLPGLPIGDRLRLFAKYFTQVRR